MDYDMIARREKKESLSITAYNRILVFSQLQPDEFMVFLYDTQTERLRPYQSFVRIGIENRNIVMYYFLDLKCYIRLGYMFDTYKPSGVYSEVDIRESLKKEAKILDRGNYATLITDFLCRDLRPQLERCKKEGRKLRLLIDLGQYLRFAPISELLNCFMKLRDDEDGVDISLILSFDVENANSDNIRGIEKFPGKILISSSEGSSLMTMNFYQTSKEDEEGPVVINMLSHEVLDSFIKNSLEVIILTILYDEAMCGYDIIKIIQQHFNVLISQGTIYPLLHNLEKKGILEVSKDDTARAKIYRPTEEGKEIIRRNLKDFLKAQQYLSEYILSKLKS
ncbi:MAG: PadR family transcriptional regulator [Thermoplasmata archaeon]